jgi:hypothetical protein
VLKVKVQPESGHRQYTAEKDITGAPLPLSAIAIAELEQETGARDGEVVAVCLVCCTRVSPHGAGSEFQGVRRGTLLQVRVRTTYCTCRCPLCAPAPLPAWCEPASPRLLGTTHCHDLLHRGSRCCCSQLSVTNPKPSQHRTRAHEHPPCTLGPRPTGPRGRSASWHDPVWGAAGEHL